MTYDQDRAAALTAINDAQHAEGISMRTEFIATAQVHATLALAAATLEGFAEPIGLTSEPIAKDDVDALRDKNLAALARLRGGVGNGEPLAEWEVDLLRDQAAASRILGPLFGEVVDEYLRAKAKHGDMTLDGPTATDVHRLAALIEEVGEVGRAMTYDQDHAGPLADELVQVANVAITWASYLRSQR
jgi:hypothetical protein